MTKLSFAQEALLAVGEKRMKTYRNAIEHYDRQAVLYKAQAKQPLREFVKDALDAGIPMRRIHQALGMQQVGQLTNFLDAQPKRLEEVLNPALAFTAPGVDTDADTDTGASAFKAPKFTFTPEKNIPGQNSEHGYWIIDSEGKRWATSIVVSSDSTMIWPEDYQNSVDAVAITEYLRNNYPNVKEY